MIMKDIGKNVVVNLISTLIVYISSFCVLWSQSANLSRTRLIIIAIGILVVGVILYFCLTQIQKARYSKKLRSVLGKEISHEKLDKDFSKIPKISIVGLAGVGKTTLIDHICRKKDKGIETEKDGAYIFNFSNNEEKYAAMLDTRGQNHSMQKDIALKSKVLIIVLDHNISTTEINIDEINDRLGRQKSFLASLNERLIRNKYEPKWIHVLLNKEDLWIQSKEKFEVENFLNEEVEILKTKFPHARITSAYHTNTLVAKITEILHTIEANI